MAFITLKTIVFQNLKKKLFNFAFLFFLCFFLLPNLVDQLQVKYDIIGVMGIKGIGVPKSFFLRICYDLTGFDTGFSQKKVN